VRRLLSVLIIGVGVAVALNQVDALQPLSTTLLASSAVVGLAVGLAARSTLANGIAGMMLATVQPFRIGDVIEWEGNRGRVEDITLTYTFVRLPSGHRLVVPNERMAASPLENFTIAGAAVEADVSVWVAPARAIEALAALRRSFPERQVTMGETEFDRAELKIHFRVPAQDEAAERAQTREQAVGALTAAGMLGEAPADSGEPDEPVS
jgi:small-conductance mechanosensitive channel